MTVRRDDPRPLIAHVLFRFDTGGLENGVVNLVNRLPRDAYRHTIVSLTSITEFHRRITRDDVEFIALNKGDGHGVALYPRVRRLLAAMRPSIVHTRNLAALEMTVPAWAAGVPIRVHGEHGRDVGDLDGRRRRYRWLRRAYRPFVNRYVALSHDLQRYLVERVGIPASRVEEICNGVDAERFSTRSARQAIPGCPFDEPGLWVVGTIGRLQPVKDQATLVRAFVTALQRDPALRKRLRLVLVGDGPLAGDLRALVDQSGVASLVWMPGERPDVPEILRGLDCFVLPSLSEGISNTILEAMATGLPVIATAVGGNPELVVDGVTGTLVPPGNPAAMAGGIVAYAEQPDAARRAGAKGRDRVEERYSLAGMVARYDSLYARLLTIHCAADARPARAA